MLIHEMPERKCDAHGCGHYLASRGSRTHRGIDLSCEGDTPVSCGLSGTVVKIGRVYSAEDKAHFKYIAIDVGSYYVRVFYVNPLVKVGDEIAPIQWIGRSQVLSETYKGITDHVHFEVYTLKDSKGGIHNKKNFEYFNPSIVLDTLRA